MSGSRRELPRGTQTAMEAKVKATRTDKDGVLCMQTEKEGRSLYEVLITLRRDGVDCAAGEQGTTIESRDRCFDGDVLTTERKEGYSCVSTSACRTGR